MARRPRSLRSWLPWLALALVLVVALVVGTRREGGPPSEQARVDRIASGIRCPTCRSISVADSDAKASEAIREEIRRQVREEGRSDSEIRASIIQRYGGDLLLEPEGTGVSGLVWALPVVALVLGGALLVYAFRRWSQQSKTPPPSDEDRALVEEARAT